MPGVSISCYTTYKILIDVVEFKVTQTEVDQIGSNMCICNLKIGMKMVYMQDDVCDKCYNIQKPIGDNWVELSQGLPHLLCIVLLTHEIATALSNVSVGNQVRNVNYRVLLINTSNSILTFTDCNVDYNKIFYLINNRWITIQNIIQIIRQCHTITLSNFVNTSELKVQFQQKMVNEF